MEAQEPSLLGFSPQSACNAGYTGSIPESGGILGGGHGNLLDNSIDRGAWRATVHGVAKSQARLSDLTLTFLGGAHMEFQILFG